MVKHFLAQGCRANKIPAYNKITLTELPYFSRRFSVQCTHIPLLMFGDAGITGCDSVHFSYDALKMYNCTEMLQLK